MPTGCGVPSTAVFGLRSFFLTQPALRSVTAIAAFAAFVIWNGGVVPCRSAAKVSPYEPDGVPPQPSGDNRLRIVGQILESQATPPGRDQETYE